MLLLLKTSSRKKSSKSSKSSKPKKYGKCKGKTTKLYTKNLSSISESMLYKLLSKKKKGKGKTKRKYQNRQKIKPYSPQAFTPAPVSGSPPAFASPVAPRPGFGAPAPVLVAPGAQPAFTELPEPVQKKMSTLIRKSQSKQSQSRKSKKDLKGDLDSLIEKVRRVQNKKKVQHYKKKLDNCRLEHCSNSNITNKEDMKNCEKNNCHSELKKYNKRFQKEYTRDTQGIHKQTDYPAFAPAAL